MKRIFLTGEWRNLIMANYPIDPPILKPYLPYKTELDYLHGNCYVSLVGFMFLDVSVRGVRIPFHVNFPEVNLRFYIRYKENTAWKRGVVFLKEIVPKPAITFVANSLFGENYATMPVKYNIQATDDSLDVAYQWKWKNKWNRVQVSADPMPAPLSVNSPEEFITEHFWGYAKRGKEQTNEYEVSHPRWNIHSVLKYEINCHFESIFGDPFATLDDRQPESIFLAEGSKIRIHDKSVLM